MRNQFLNRICRWFAMHYLPSDDETALASALFDLKYRS